MNNSLAVDSADTPSNNLNYSGTLDTSNQTTEQESSPETGFDGMVCSVCGPSRPKELRWECVCGVRLMKRNPEWLPLPDDMTPQAAGMIRTFYTDLMDLERARLDRIDEFLDVVLDRRALNPSILKYVSFLR